MEPQWHQGGGRISLGNNTGVEAVMLQPIRFHCVRIRISTGLGIFIVNSDPRRIFQKLWANHCLSPRKCPYWNVRTGWFRGNGIRPVPNWPIQLPWLKISILFLSESKKIPRQYTDLATTTSFKILIHHLPTLPPSMLYGHRYWQHR
jgi:hypothetical protein